MKRFLLILLVLSSANAVAALNKWVDSDGKVHYSDQPPPANVKAQKLRIPSDAAPAAANVPAAASAEAASAVAASAPAAPKTVAEREAELKKEQQAKKEAADKAAAEQAKTDAIKANCAAAQQQLRLLQDGMRMIDIDAKGERSYLDDQQRQQRIERAQQDVKTYCK